MLIAPAFCVAVLGDASFPSIPTCMSVPQNQRLTALDAFRGLTIASMILVNSPGSWSYVYWPLDHAKWHGLTPTDLVFPFFLFIGGVSMWFSFAAFGQKPNSDLLRKIFWRAVSIYVVYVIIVTFPFVKQDWDFSKFRILGVLPRIALCYLGVSLWVLFMGQRKQAYVAVGILLGYWLVMWLGGTGADRYGLATNFQRQLDLMALGENHLYKGEGLPFDPEGLLSTLPAMVTMWLGYEVGRRIAQRQSWGLLLSRMLVWGGVLVAVGGLWHFVFPINKKIWTSSYVLVTGGLAIWFLTLWLWLTEVKGWKKLAYPFTVYGTNAIFAYLVSDLYVISLLKIKYQLYGKSVSGYTYLYETVFRQIAGDYNGSLLFAVAMVVLFWLLLWWMHRKKLYVKL